ncbi:MAG: aspartate-semialdehyde dehydrogenase [Candidatus Eisenbacteria bacterium]|nr:aspartate-semialdehyde dehydrogenase [Candidatus Eisenbacteria bacterium]
MTTKELRIGIAGATGAVGTEMLRVLEDRSFPVGTVVPMASEGGGRTVLFRDTEVPVVELSDEALDGVDVLLMATSASISSSFAPRAASRGVTVIDNSRAFRMDPGVPLVVPEVNPGALAGHGGIIANPNCSTIQTVLALEPIREAAGVSRVVVSTYQSVSGTGSAAIEELTEQSRAVLDGEPAVTRVYPHRIAFNVLPAIDVFDDEGHSREELKMVRESRKILGLPGLRMAATCVRVPVYRGHAVAVNVETEACLEPSAARELLARSPGLAVVDDPSADGYPTPLDSAHNDTTWVGRIRRDPSVENGLILWVVSDNLRKGAATNAVQIAELLLEDGADT